MRRQLWIQGNRREGCHGNRGRGELLLPSLREGGGAGLPAVGLPGPSSALGLDSRPSLSAAAESYSTLGYQEWKREVKELRCFIQTGLQVRVDTLLWNCFACLHSCCSFPLPVGLHARKICISLCLRQGTLTPPTRRNYRAPHRIAI